MKGFSRNRRRVPDGENGLPGKRKPGQPPRGLDPALAELQRPWVSSVVMSDHIYKKIELVGSSPDGVEQAVNNAVERASRSVRNMRWFEVSELRGHIEDDQVAHWQATVKIGFTLDE